ncbi:MAG: 2Fe-2S iron-sulfur cluster binding domain-containing protein [Oligoflexia bacterium]|nr:2Fe-2S iron-sulfur cluster binding domain-containing protein [Oligoflexia bacterium]
MGTNPFIDSPPPPLPTKPYRLTIKNTGQVLLVDPAKLPKDDDGEDGSVLSSMLAAGIDIDHSCGGVCACSTCHVLVHQGLSTAPDPIDEEDDQLDFAPGVQDNSRLACQFVPDGSSDVVVEIPDWNRNQVSENH